MSLRTTPEEHRLLAKSLAHKQLNHQSIHGHHSPSNSDIHARAFIYSVRTKLFPEYVLLRCLLCSGGRAWQHPCVGNADVVDSRKAHMRGI